MTILVLINITDLDYLVMITERFSLFVDPILGYEVEIDDNNNSTYWNNGIKLSGSFNDNIGFNLEFYDNHLSGTIIR